MTKQQTAMQRPESESKNILIRMATFLFLLMIGAMPWKMASMV